MHAAAIDNLSIRGAAAAYEAQHVELQDDHVRRAEAAIVADLDTLTDWLAGECMRAGHVDSDWAMRVPGRLAVADVPVVLHALLTADDADDLRAARDELVRRYLKHSAAYVAREALDIASGWGAL